VLWRFSMMVAICSPSRRLRVLSLRQCTPPMLRRMATLQAILFSSPPTFMSGPSSPVYSGSTPSAVSAGCSILSFCRVSGCTFFSMRGLMGWYSSNQAFSIVTQAPATVAWPAP
jgi:hypothetical protein